jgi:hypothetical protein
MEKERCVGQQKILFDRDATVALYRQTITVPGADDCSSISCENRSPHGPVLYGGWFLFAGELVKGVDKRSQLQQDGFAHWFTTSFPGGTLPTDVKLCAVEFLARIPWVLPKIPE